mgnify:CR=1 FL=1
MAADSLTNAYAPPLGERPRCAYVLVASRKYFRALAVLLHSLFRQNNLAPDTDCDTLVMLWSPNCSDSVLSLEQRQRVECLAGRRRVDWAVAQHERMRIWNAVRLPVQLPGVCLLMSLEMFFLNVTAVIHFDLDMLVLRPVSFVAGEVLNEKRSALHQKKLREFQWILHGHCHSGNSRQHCPTHIQLGFTAFLAPAAQSFRHALLAVSIKWTKQARLAKNGDQDIVNKALEMHDATIPRRWPALKKKIDAGRKLR